MSEHDNSEQCNSKQCNSELGSNEFTEFEGQLSQLAPRRSQVNRETLLFRAGQESVRASRQKALPSSWLWPLTTAAMALVSTGLCWQLYTQPEPQVVERVRIVERSVEAKDVEATFDREPVEKSPVVDAARILPSPTSDLPRDHYLLRRELALTLGMDALTVPVAIRLPDAADESSYRQLRSTYTDPSSVNIEQQF